MKNFKYSPYILILVSFFIIILIGGTVLSLPISTLNNQGTKWIDGIFTATSAVCVTGLAVNNVSSVYNLFGKIMILILVQIGAVGLIAITSLVVILISKKIKYNTKKIIQEAMNTENIYKIQEYVKNVFKTVFIIEGIGAILLFIEFSQKLPFKKAIFYAIFHSVSAFCNAGFALFDNNLMEFKSSIIINTVIPALVILGGTGFASLLNLYKYFISKKDKRLTLTTKLGVFTSILLLIIGTILILILEYSNPLTMGNYTFFEKIGAAFFQSMSTRTAGFNTMSIGELRNQSILIFVILMFIGASPGSTGGGIKTTTISVIVLGLLNTVGYNEEIETKDRRINWTIYNRAIAITVISIIYINIILFLLLIIEKNVPFIKLLFELVSAFGTVGLSMNLTPHLQDISKWLIILTMFIGRVGPLTVTLALSEKVVKRGSYRLPEENILIG